MTHWQPLDEELDKWQDAGEPVTLWWRDDDACILTPQLRKLVAIADENSVPIHLAVIPARLEADTVSFLSSSPNTRILQHGYAHIDHAPKGQGSWELGEHRPIATVVDDLQRGYNILDEAFGKKFLPVLVPPWTRFSEKLRPLLPGIGIKAYSAEGERSTNNDSDVKVIHAHSDPIKWKDNARFKGADRVIDDFVTHLQRRRQGLCDPTEPTGLCTHHMDHSQELWDFLDEFVCHTSQHSGAKWISIDRQLS